MIPIKDVIKLIPRDSVEVETNQTVTVTGVVTTPSPTPVSRLGSFIQDKTGGIRLFQASYNGPPLSVGDSVIATGKLGLYKGQEELREPKIEIIKHGIQIVPAVVTAREVKSGKFEGMLVNIKGTVLRKILFNTGTLIYFKDTQGDTTALFANNYAVSQFVIDQIHKGEMLSVTGAVSRFTETKPYLDKNQIFVRFPSDIVLSRGFFLAHYLPVIVMIAIAAGGILIILLVFNYLLRTQVRQKTKQIEEQTRVSSAFYDGIAELTGLLYRKEIIGRAMKRANLLIGTSSAIFGELTRSSGECILTAFDLVNGQLFTEVRRFKSDALIRVVEKLSGTDALWNTSISELMYKDSPLTEGDKDLLEFLKKHLTGRKITMTKPLPDSADFFFVFDHTGPISEKLPRALILSYISHVYSAFRAAELFGLTKRQGAALEKLYNHSVFGLLTLSHDGTVLTANKIASEMLNDSDLIGKKIRDYLAPEDTQRFNELLPSLSTIAAEKFVRFEAQMSDKLGGAELEFAMEFDSHSEIIYVSVQDISDRRAYEDYAAQEKKIETLEKLAASLSHDLNNIVGSTMGYASLLKRKLPTNSKEYHYADIIENSSKRTAELVKQVLGFSQIDTKTVDVVDLNNFVNDVAIDFGKTRSDKYAILMSPYNQPVRTRVSTSQLKQVLLAVLENAADSMENGGTISCSISLSEKSGAPLEFTQKGKQCFVEVEDHGAGMDKAIKRRIFEPFFTTKRIKKYTGLSLSAAFNIIKHHKGFIDVDSTPGVGTKVRIYLPHYSEEDDSKKRTETSTNFNARGIKVLVVDDEENVRQLGCDILSEHGYNVITANDGFQALERLRENQDIDLVVLDMIMPVMGGKETCIEIKKKTKSPKVLICTGYSELSDLESILGTYADGLLQKPYSTSDLLASVENLLKGPSSGKA